jgi:signal transduction histidine kinase
LQRASELRHRGLAWPALPATLARRGANVAGSISLLGRVVAGSALFALLIAGAFTLMLSAMSDLRRSTNVQAQAKDVTAATLGVERVVNQLEVSLRSYAITRNHRFLVTWRQGRANLAKSIARLDRLVATEPRLTGQTKKLETTIASYITEYGVPLISIANISAAAAAAPVATKEGLHRIATIRNQLSRLLETEDSAASSDAASAKHEADHAIEAGVGAVAATGALLVVYAVFLVRGVTRPVRTVAAGASRVAAGDLSTRLPESGAAEIHTLTRSFNAMARSLDQGKRELEAQNEELRHSQRMMSQVVSIVSHELRTPLTSIIGYTRLLLRREVDEADRRHYLEIVQEQGARLATLVDEFLASERIASGQLELRDELVDLKELLIGEAAVIDRDASRHRVEVRVAERSLLVRGDRARLAQVVVNLLANAIKYSPDGGPVDVAGRVAGGVVRVEVHDRGIGVPDEHQARIFTRFFRGDARQSGIAGTGLGLAVSREIVEAHGGRIGFTTRSGPGSTFWFELPAATAEP